MAKVIFLDQYAGLGGGQRILMDLSGAFRDAGHAVRVMVPGEGNAAQALGDAGFPVLPLPLPGMTAGKKPLSEKLAHPLHARRAAAAIVQAIGDGGADLIYANAPRCFLPAVLAARRTGVPVVCGLHLIFRGGLEHWLIRWCFRQPQVKRVVFCSEAVAQPFRDACGDKGRTVLYWVSPEFLGNPRTSASARVPLGLAQGQVAIGVLGRISKTKGQRLFLEALLPLLGPYPGLKLFVAGASDFEDPNEEAAVKATAARALDPERVMLTGKMVESRPFLDAMDVLVVPSLWDEPFGLVAVEAMARSLPVVVTRSGGLTEIVEHGVTGFHSDKDAGSLRRTVERLVADPSLRARMGEAGRERVERRFNPAVQMGEIMTLCFGGEKK